MRRCEDESGSEEELYVSEQTVVWSRGLPDATASVLKSFTVDSPVQDVCINFEVCAVGIVLKPEFQ